MTHIEQMIQDLCPNGVEFKTLGEVCEIRGRIGFRGYTRQDQVSKGEGAISLSPANIKGSKISYDDSTYITWEKYKESPEIMVDNGDVIFCKTASVGKTAYIDELPEKATINPQLVLLKNIKCNSKFLSYYLQTPRIQDVVKQMQGVGSVPNVSQAMLSKLAIPLPPIEIQKKIVECLDKFSALAAELQAELQMRRKQYEYYRTQLLTPHSDCNSADNTDDCNWEWKTLGEIFELRGGYTPSKNKPEFWEEGTIPWFRMEDIRENGRILKDAILHISPIAVKGQGLFEKDSFVLATSATIGEHALLAVDALTNQRFTNLKVRKQYKSVLYTKFIFYYMFKVDEFCKAHTNISGFESVDMDALRKMPFPIPPLSEQIRIADLLDKFEALTTSLSDGIPAEQAAQQKRYEYYRDLLLTFDRKAV